MSEGRDMKQIGVTINLDKERHLVFDLDSFCEMEEKYGSVNEVFKAIGKGSMKDLRYITWLGLKNEDEKLNEKDAGHLIKAPQFKELSDKLILALGLSLPKADNKQKNDQPKETPADTKKKDSLGRD